MSEKRELLRFGTVVVVSLLLGAVLAAGQSIVFDPDGSPAASIPGTVDISSGEYNASETPPPLDVGGSWIRIGDADGAASQPNGLGIKFTDIGQSHGTLYYDSANERFVLCESSGNNVLTCDTGSETLRVNVNTGEVTVPNGNLDMGGNEITNLGSAGGGCSSSNEGDVRYNSSEGQLQVCDGTRWAGLKYDTTPADCTEISGGSGQYTIDVDGDGGNSSFDVYCDMDTAGGGWTLAFNLNTADGNIRGWNDNTFWTSDTTIGSLGSHFSNDFKSTAYSIMGINEILIKAHYSGDGNPMGYVNYTLTSSFRGKTFRNMMNDGLGQTISGDGTPTVLSAINWEHNIDRDQSLHGDIFIEVEDSNYNYQSASTANPLVINKNTVWCGPSDCADLQRFRLATTLKNNDYKHTFAGMGIRHEEGNWKTYTEASPIFSYCDYTDDYGTDYNDYGSSQPHSGSCYSGRGVGQDRNVDYAVFIR